MDAKTIEILFQLKMIFVYFFLFFFFFKFQSLRDNPVLLIHPAIIVFEYTQATESKMQNGSSQNHDYVQYRRSLYVYTDTYRT